MTDKLVRCAIYTRKSADEAADSHLGSTTVQRELCEAYITSQSGEGWICLPQVYDDVGWSGGNLDRPALRQLRADIAAGLVDTVIVYKIDRLSRSLKDFVGLVDELERCGVGFASITQAFSTTSSMGKLTLNILLSFAQFERDVTSERLRDYFAGARKRGIWNSPRPFGYQRNTEGRLVIVPEEAAVVRLAYRLYCKHGTCRLVANDLNIQGYRNKFGRPWMSHTTIVMLTNRLYLGDIVHRGKAEPGMHEPIISMAMWRKVQARLEISRHRRAGVARDPDESLLRGRIRHHHGRALIHVTAKGRNGLIYRYYVPAVERYGPDTKPQHRFKAIELEDSVVGAIAPLIALKSACQTHNAKLKLVRRHIEMVTVHDDKLAIKLYSGGEIETVLGGESRIRYEWPKRKPPPWLSDAQALVASGLSLSESARRLGKPLSTLHRVIRRWQDHDDPGKSQLPSI